MSTSYLESENEVLEYVLRIPLQRKIQDIILGQYDLTSTFISCKSIDGKLNDEIVSGFFTFLERVFSDANSLPTKWCLDWERKCCSAVVNFIYQPMKVKITGFW